MEAMGSSRLQRCLCHCDSRDSGQGHSLIDAVRLTQTGVAESKHKTSAFCPRESFISEEDHVEAMKVFSETYMQDDRVSVDGIKVLGALSDKRGSLIFSSIYVSNVVLLADEGLPWAKRRGLMLALSHPRVRQSDLINQGVGLDRCHGSRNDIDIVSKRHYLKLVP